MKNDWLLDVGFYSIIAMIINFIAIVWNIISWAINLTPFHWWLVWLFIGLFIASLLLHLYWTLKQDK